jgi:parallel beta-helix repeat protein
MNKPTAIAVCLLGAAGLFWFAQAGDLEPPGPPAPTMKTLDEVEPRTPIRASDLPLTITQPGSYYFAESISTAGGGITIDSDDVTIDLMGYTLSGGTGRGIEVVVEHNNIEVRNGVVTGWSEDGIGLWSTIGVRVVNVRSDGNGHIGIGCGANCTVDGCVVQNNGQGGVTTGGGGRVVSTTAYSNGSAAYNCGIKTESRSLVKDSVATHNNDVGIMVGNYSLVVDSVASENDSFGIYLSGWSSASSSIANYNGGSGFHLDGFASVSNSMASRNDLHGIRVFNDANVTGNKCSQNGRDGDGAGVYAEFYGNRIDGNDLRSNDQGIKAIDAGNLIIRNSATGNTANYDIVAGNDVGPIGSAATATSPWANIEH